MGHNSFGRKEQGIDAWNGTLHYSNEEKENYNDLEASNTVSEEIEKFKKKMINNFNKEKQEEENKLRRKIKHAEEIRLLEEEERLLEEQRKTEQIIFNITLYPEEETKELIYNRNELDYQTIIINIAHTFGINLEYYELHFGRGVLYGFNLDQDNLDYIMNDDNDLYELIITEKL